MTVDAVPWAVDGVSTSSEAVRKFQMGLLGSTFDPFDGGVGATDAGAHGVTTSGALLVTQSATPAMTVRVAAGSAFIRGTASATQGVVPFHNTAAVDNLTISVGDATNPRHDLVCAQHRNDDFDASGFKDNRLFVVEGTPAATPVDPALPDGCLVLARVVVEAGESTSILNADITDLRTRGPIGVLAEVGPNGTFPVADSAASGGIAYKGGMVKIAEQVAATATLTFSNIPQHFDHLHLEARPNHNNGSGAGVFRALVINFNGDTGANYDVVFAFADGSGAPTNSVSDNTANPGILTIGPQVGSLIIDIPDYAGGGFKTAHATGAARTGASTGATRNILSSDVLWANSAAITSITLFILSAGGDEFGPRVFSLYGLG